MSNFSYLIVPENAKGQQALENWRVSTITNAVPFHNKSQLCQLAGLPPTATDDELNKTLNEKGLTKYDRSTQSASSGHNPFP